MSAGGLDDERAALGIEAVGMGPDHPRLGVDKGNVNESKTLLVPSQMYCFGRGRRSSRSGRLSVGEGGC